MKDEKGLRSREHELTQGKVMFDQPDDFLTAEWLAWEGRAVGLP